MPGRLEDLLRRIRDGLAGPGDLAEARALARSDDRLPDEIRALALVDDDDLAGDAAGLLAVLGADDLFGDSLFDALLAEAGPLSGDDHVRDEPVTAVAGRLAGELPVELDEDPGWLPLADALRHGLRAEAAGVDLADAVGHALGLSHVEVAGAVLREAGTVELAAGVAEALGLDVPHVAAAVRAEAGDMPELAAAVLSALGDSAAPVAEAVRAESGADEVDSCDIAAAVLAAVGAAEVPASGVPVVPVARALRAEAGGVELAGAVLSSLGLSALPVAEAVHAEAGAVEIADPVLRTLSPEALAGVLDHELDDTTHRLAAVAIHEDQRGDELTAMAELGSELRAALRAEAGAVELWAAVAGPIGIADPEHVEGWDATILAEAVRAEAGAVDLADAVLGEVRRTRPVQMPLAEVPVESLPPRVNRSTWALGSFLAVAVALFALGMQGVLAPLFGAGGEVDAIRAEPDLVFASADEVVVEDLQYGEDVTVFQTEGDAGAVIIWVDEEAVL